jgi:hypothetical protein
MPNDKQTPAVREKIAEVLCTIQECDISPCSSGECYNNILSASDRILSIHGLAIVDDNPKIAENFSPVGWEWFLERCDKAGFKKVVDHGK